MKNFDLKHLLLLIPIGILLIVQLPNLSLPYFWDEAWSYITAIKAMAKAGPSLLPGVVSLDYCKGHPQFFFFISSAWMNLISGSIPLMRLLPLMFSIGVIVVAYFGLLKIANWQSAIFASVLIAVQSMFLAQSIFLLPEMLLTLFFILSFFFFLNRNFIGYAIACTLMILTKETAIVFAITFGLYFLMSLLIKSEREKFKPLQLLLLIIPGLIYALFLLLHYKKFGIWFYGDHLGYITYDWYSIKEKSFSAIAHLFVKFGRSAISVLAIVSLIALFFQKNIAKRPLILGVVSIFSFMTFSVLNFYTQRYGLVVLVLFIILFAYVWGQLKINLYLKSSIILILAIVCLVKTFSKGTNSDIDLGYVETIKVHQDMVHYCEENNLQDETMAVSFNMIFNLRDRELGYVTGEKNFTKINDWKSYLNAKYFIYESTFENNEIVQYSTANFKLIKSFTNKHAFGYIYENPNFKQPE
jgi:hypothetical protein